jgi:spore germination cell wall hydrolase CwlJ-like protein
MAAGMGLTPEQREILLQALIQGGNSGMTDPALALRNIMQAQGGPSAAQAIIAGLRNRLMPSGAPTPGAPSPATQAARGLSGEEPNYAKVDDRPGGVLSEPTPAKKDDIAEAAKKLAEKTPGPPEPPSTAAGGILAMGPSQGPDPGTVSVPDVPDAGTSVRRAVGASALPTSQRDLMTRMVMMEAGNQSQLGKEAVAHVIMNRVRDGRYGDGVQGVLTRKSQFEPWGNPKTRQAMMATPTDSPRYQAANQAVERVLSGESPDPTNGATHFLNKATSAARGDSAMRPGGWGRTGRDQVTIGGHTFMKADAGRGPGPGPAGQAQLAMRDILGKDTQSPSPSMDMVDAPLPPRRPAELGGAPDLPTTEADLGPDLTDDGGDTSDLPTTDTDLGPDLAEGGIPDIGGLLGGLDTGDAGADEPSQFAQESAEDEKEPDKPILPEEDRQTGGILSGGGLLGEPNQERVDLSRVFSPEGMGGTGLFGRDQGPDPTGFKAPVGLPTAGQGDATSASPSPTAGILGAPSTGIATITPPQLKSIAPSVPLPPPRPPNIDVNIGSSALPPPDIMLPPPRPAGIGGMGVELPPARPPGLLTDALPPPRPPGIGGEVPLPPRRPPGLLGTQPGTQFGAIPSQPPVDPDRFARDPFPALASPPALDPDRMVRDAPWQDPPSRQQPGLLGADDMFAKFARGAGSLSGLLGQAADQTGGRKRLSGSVASPPLVPQTPLLTGGLLSNARQGIDLNRFFGLLSGRVG